MHGPKNYMTLNDLQLLCENLRLSTDGRKSELIERLLVHTAMLNRQLPGVSRICYSNSRVVPIQETDQIVQADGESSDSKSDGDPVEQIQFSNQSTQTSNETLTSSFNFNSIFFKLIFVFLAVLFVIGLSGGFVAIFQFFDRVEMIKVPVKRSWFRYDS